MPDEQTLTVGGTEETKPVPEPSTPALETAESLRAKKIEQYELDEADKPDPRMPMGEANVCLARSREHDALPSGVCNIGLGKSLVIPKKAQQLSGFHTPHASLLVHQFPQYKFVQRKGEPRTQQPTTGQ